MREFEISVSPEIGFQEDRLTTFLEKSGKVSVEENFEILLRSIDARSKKPKVKLRIGVDTHHSDFVEYHPDNLRNVSNAPRVLIIGAGPAGLFAAFRALETGLKPIIIERGKDVRSRRRDIAAINKEQLVNPDSNYCFGEGGAGTYSDGKLYTRSKKRGSVRKIFEILVAHGATPDILFESHPHIGTNKLPKIITEMRETIISMGGEIHFERRLEDLIIADHKISGIRTAAGDIIEGEALVLATGHSARDIYELLNRKNIHIEAKPFALGVRIEHPQEVIDEIQYHQCPRDPNLPAAAYSLVHQTFLNRRQRGVFSFCMCPGGFIVPAATAQEEIVVNGMSPSRRDSKYANSGIVVAVESEDWKEYQKLGALGALRFQQVVERKAWERGGRKQIAPAQRMTDFVSQSLSSDLPETSYQPGVISADLREVLPPFIAKRLSMALKTFGQKMKGYLTEEALLVGVESRTSSPVKIPRDSQTLEHPQIQGLYPCGEGAGFAGGIVSAAMDGDKVMQQIAVVLKS